MIGWGEKSPSVASSLSNPCMTPEFKEEEGLFHKNSVEFLGLHGKQYED